MNGLNNDNIGCPVCYLGYDRHTNIPKVLPCGHTICSACIPNLERCAMCRYVINRRPVHNRQMMGDEYFQNFGYEHPNRDPSGANTNYQLLDLIEQKFKKDKKEFEVCQKSKMYKDIYCLDCKVLECQSCFDSSHIGHINRRIPESIFKIQKQCQ